MRFSRLVVCAVVVLLAALPFQPWLAAKPGSCFFEAKVVSSKSGLLKLFYDIGNGYNETDEGLAAVVAGEASTVRIPLPAGTLGGLRLAFQNGELEMTISGARVVDASGNVLRQFPAAEIRGYSQIDKLEAHGDGVLVGSSRDASYPQVMFLLPRPMPLPLRHWWWGMIFGFVLLSVAVVLAERWAGNGRIDRLWSTLVARPGPSIVGAALLGTLLANYPVIFAGKSLLSPNLNTALLYVECPYVPGFQSVEKGNSNSADIDALMWEHLPLSMMQARALLTDHELPLWNRYNSTGISLLGQGQSCFGDPLQLLPILARGASWAWDLKFLVAKALLGIGVGFCVWRLTGHLGSSALMAISAQFIGFFVYRINHPAIFSLCYSPWILYAWFRILEARTLPRSILWLGALLAANGMELCSGTVKEAYILLLSLNFSGACMLLMSDRPWAAKFRLLAASAGAGVVFAMGTSPGWFTFLRELRGSRTTYDAPQTFQLQPGMAVGLFDEVFYRPFQVFINVINPSANFFVLIGLIWVFAAWKSSKADRRVVALLVSALPALLLVYGIVPPALVARVPFLGNILHIDNTFSCVLIVLFTVLAGFGWKQAWAILGTEEGRSASVRVASVVVVMYVFYVGTVQAVVRSQYYLHTWGSLVKPGSFVQWYGLSLVGGSVLLLWVLCRLRTRGAWTSGTMLLGLLAFASLHWRLGLHIGMAAQDYVIMPTSRVDLLAPSPAVEAVKGRMKEPQRAIGFMDNFFPGWTGAYGIESICGPEALMNKDYRDLMSASGIERVWDWRYRLEDKDLVAVKPLLDLLNVRYYLDYPAGHRGGRDVLSPVFSGDMEVYESKGAWPRAFFTDVAAVYSEAPDFWDRVKGGDGRPFAAIQHDDWLGLSPAPAVSSDLSQRVVAPASDYVLTQNATTFSVTASGPGVIVLTEAYEQGDFKAYLNGARVPYFRVNQAFKGIYVDSPGTYLVTFSYWPHDLTTTLIVAAVGALFGLAGFFAALKSARTEGSLAPFEV
jgi:hypothetical protein